MTTNTMKQAAEPALIHSFFANSQPVAGLSVLLHYLEQQTVSLVDLEQVENLLNKGTDLLPSRILSPAEQSFFKRFRYMKRKREWLGGRIAAKAAMRHWPASGQLGTGSGETEKAMGQLTILPDEHGRPVVDRDNREAGTSSFPAISISHSNRFAVALAGPGQACGIDLQEVSPKLSGLTDRFTFAREMKLMADMQIDELTGLTMLWSAKEAVKKSILHDQPSIFSGIKVQQVKAVSGHCRQFCCAVQGQPTQIVMVYIFAPYVLALTRSDHHA